MILDSSKIRAITKYDASPKKGDDNTFYEPIEVLQAINSIEILKDVCDDCDIFEALETFEEGGRIEILNELTKYYSYERVHYGDPLPENLEFIMTKHLSDTSLINYYFDLDNYVIYEERYIGD